MDAVLGKKVAAPQYYAPEVLEPIDRSLGRRGITGPSLHVDQGHDVWHCYELSWLLPDGQVRYATGVLVVPASSPFTVESKSLKLYLRLLVVFGRLIILQQFEFFFLLKPETMPKFLR